MKKIILLTFLSALVSCGKKMNSKIPEIPMFIEDHSIDSDYDGLSDAFENSLGMNSNIADIPLVELQTDKDISIQSKFYTNSEFGYKKNRLLFEKENKNFTQQLRDKVAYFAYKRLFGIDEGEFNLTFKDFFKKEQKCLTQKQRRSSLKDLYQAFENHPLEHHQIDFSYKFNFKAIKKLTAISNIKASLFLNNQNIINFEPIKKHYYLKQQTTDLFETFSQRKLFHQSLLDNLKDEACFSTIVEDFNYTVDNKKLNYKKVIEGVEQNNAHVLILHKGKSQLFSLNPKKYNLETFFKSQKFTYQLGYEGQIQSLKGMENEFYSLDDLNLMNTQDIEKRRWFYFSNSKRQAPGKLEKSYVYVLAHLSLKEIMSVASNRSFKKINHAFDSVKLFDLLPTDIIVIETRPTAQLIVPPLLSKKVEGYLDLFFKWVQVKDLCHYQESNANISSFNYKFKEFNDEQLNHYSLAIGAKKKKVRPQVINNKFLYEFTIGEEDLIGDELEIFLPKTAHAKGSYTRLKSWTPVAKQTRCAKHRERLSKEVRQTSDYQLIFDLNIERFGIKR